MKKVAVMQVCIGIVLVSMLLAGCYKGDTYSPGNFPSSQGQVATDATERPEGMRHLRPGKQIYNFITSFSPSRLGDKRRVGTPTGAGVLTLSLGNSPNNKKSLILLASFSYTYPLIKVRSKNEFLELRAADPWSSGAGVRALVEASVGRNRLVIFRHEFAPYSGIGPSWEIFDVPLAAFAGKSVEFTIAAEPVLGDQTAAWLALSDAELKDPVK